LKKRNFHDFKEKNDISMEKPDETLLFGQRENEAAKEDEVLENPLKR